MKIAPRPSLLAALTAACIAMPIALSSAASAFQPADAPAKKVQQDKKEKKKDAKPKVQAPSVGSAAPAWTVKDGEGKDHKLADFKGKVVLVDFWATWCPPCKAAMPEIQKIHEKYKDKGVEVIGISVWEKDGDPVKYMKDNKFTYRALVKGEDAATAYGVEGIPNMWVIGKDGKIVEHVIGHDESTSKTLTAAIDKALGGDQKDAKPAEKQADKPAEKTPEKK